MFSYQHGFFNNARLWIPKHIGYGIQPSAFRLINALLLYLFGARTIYTYDHVPHVRYELVKMVVSKIAEQIEQVQLITSIPKSLLSKRLLKLIDAANTKEIFRHANIIYIAPGDATNTGLPDGSIDLVYSNAVLEHVPESVLHGLTIETKRILRENGIAYHVIGLHDHYISFDKNISKVNFLKYPEWFWSLFVKNQISYTNRLRERQFVEIFKSYGAKVRIANTKIDQHDLEILKTMKINKRFSGMTDRELAVHHSEIILSF